MLLTMSQILNMSQTDCTECESDGCFLMSQTERHIFDNKKINKYKYIRLRPFQEYCTYIEPIVNQRWVKARVPGEKPPNLPVQNLASHMCPEQGSNHSGERSNV